MYVVSAGDEVTVRPPTTINHVAPAAQHSVRPGRRGGSEHVERYVAGGVTAVTVSVRPHQRYRRERQQNDQTVNDVNRQLSNYEPVLDEYLHAAMATHDANISNRSGKVHS